MCGFVSNGNFAQRLTKHVAELAIITSRSKFGAIRSSSTSCCRQKIIIPLFGREDRSIGLHLQNLNDSRNKEYLHPSILIGRVSQSKPRTIKSKITSASLPFLPLSPLPVDPVIDIACLLREQLHEQQVLGLLRAKLRSSNRQITFRSPARAIIALSSLAAASRAGWRPVSSRYRVIVSDTYVHNPQGITIHFGTMDIVAG